MRIEHSITDMHEKLGFLGVKVHYCKESSYSQSLGSWIFAETVVPILLNATSTVEVCELDGFVVVYFFDEMKFRCLNEYFKLRSIGCGKCSLDGLTLTLRNHLNKLKEIQVFLDCKTQTSFNVE